MTITKLPFPRYKRGTLSPKHYILPEDLFVEQWQVPAGTDVLLFTSQNFGNVLLPSDTKDVRGFTIPRRLFRY